MKKNFLLVLLLFVSGSYTIAQNRCSYVPPRQADNWLFHQNAGLKFDQSGPAVNNQANFILGSGSASISDENGNLIFYTDGINVWNAAFENITFGDPLKGIYQNVQAALIVPNPFDKRLNSIFTSGGFNNGVPAGMHVSTVDMDYNNFKGAVMDRNILLVDRTAGMLTGVVAGDSSGYWAVTRGVDNSNFYAFKVTATGVDTLNPVISSVGTALNGTLASEQYIGAIKIAPRGDKIAMVSYGGPYIEIFRFDNITGSVSSAVSITPPYTALNTGPSYVQFSPDGSKLYVNIFNKSFSTGRLYQFDLSLPDAQISSSAVWLNDPANGFLNTTVSAMQLARDGKIYVCSIATKTMNVIENPNRPGNNCNYKEGTYPMNTIIRLGLPNFIESFFNIPPVDYDTKCDGDLTVFDILNKSNNGVVSWDFGDAGNTVPGIGPNPTHLFSGPGNYTVTMTETFNSLPFTTTFPVHIDSLPPKSFRAYPTDSLYIFPGSSIPLNAGPDMFSYLWQDGKTEQFYNVSDAGLYSVEYVDIRCCKNSDSLKVIALDISLPNAFTPDGDGLNDVFRALGPTDGIEDFTLTIYNRYGQLLWEAANFEDKWDGKVKGQPLPTGVYAWNMTFNVKGNVMELGKIIYRGSVTLLR